MFKDNFENEELDNGYESLGIPLSDECIDIDVRQGHLRIFGHQNIDISPSIVGRTVSNNHFTLSTKIDFEPKNIEQKAGLVTCFNTSKIYFFYLEGISKLGEMHLKVSSIKDGDSIELITERVDLSKITWVQLKISYEEGKLLFYYSTQKYRWHKVGPSLKERTRGKNQNSKSEEILVGMGVKGPVDKETYADFEYFKIEPHR